MNARQIEITTMKITIKKTTTESSAADLVVIPVVSTALPLKKLHHKKDETSHQVTEFWEGISQHSRAELRRLDKAFSGEISRKLQLSNFTPDKGARLDILLSDPLSAKGKRRAFILRLSCISEHTLTENGEGDCALEEWRNLGGDAYRTAAKNNTEIFAISLQGVSQDIQATVVQAVVEGAMLSEYKYSPYKSKARTSRDRSVQEMLLAVSESNKETTAAIERGRAQSEAVNFTRDLVNCPPNDLQPLDVVKVARKIASRRNSGIRLKVFNRKALSQMKANALLAVAQGSAAEPYLLHLAYQPLKRTRSRKKIIFIGKGVTFDSGGLSIKPAKSMEDMKCDMAGAAAVLGVMKMLSEQPQKNRPRHEIHAIIPTTENMVNGWATRPGDIVKAMNGKTVEILNTDAEGRLILADALAYSAKLKPDLIVDLATLTGACVVALGSDYAAIFCNNSELENTLRNSAQEAGEQLWPLPLAKEYRPLLDSTVADLRNIGTGGPGAIIGALFLNEFVPEGAHWAHLDIAGPAFRAKSSDYVPEGGTGFGVRMLIRFLEKEL